VDVPMMDPYARTPYAWTGEGFDALCVLATLWLVWPPRRRRDPASTAAERAAA